MLCAHLAAASTVYQPSLSILQEKAMNLTKPQTRQTFNRDGVDHVNVSAYTAYSDTEIGKIASPDWRKTFFVPHVGDFITPRAFANWMVSGGKEHLRHSTGIYRTTVPLSHFRTLLLFAKYYQLCGMRAALMTAQNLTNLPWVMYKKHISGVREYDRWDQYPAEVKEMVKYIIQHGSRNHYNDTDAIECFDAYMRDITGKDFVPFEELNRITKEKAIERSAADKRRIASTQAQQDVQESPTADATVADGFSAQGGQGLSYTDNSVTSESAITYTDNSIVPSSAAAA